MNNFFFPPHIQTQHLFTILLLSFKVIIQPTLNTLSDEERLETQPKRLRPNVHACCGPHACEIMFSCSRPSSQCAGV